MTPFELFFSKLSENPKKMTLDPRKSSYGVKNVLIFRKRPFKMLSISKLSEIEIQVMAAEQTIV